MRVAAAVSLLASSMVAAQAPGGAAGQGPSSPAQPAIRAQSTVVLVPALVRNAKGELVFTLKAGDFRVTDDGV